MAQLTSKVFQVLDDRHTRNGANVFVAAGQTLIEPGIIVAFTSGSTVVVGTTTIAHGVAFGTRALTYAPTTQVFAAGEPLVVIEGEGEALISGDFFTGGTLPSAGSLVYAGTNGLWDATASSGVKIARCIEQQTVRQPVATGTSITVARVLFNFTNTL